MIAIATGFMKCLTCLGERETRYVKVDFDTGARPGLVTAIEARLATLPAVLRLGQLPTIAVRHVGARLLMNITLPPGATPAEEESIVTWAVRCLREQDPHALTADVSVEGRGSAV
jgi:hypothetical protein